MLLTDFFAALVVQCGFRRAHRQQIELSMRRFAAHLGRDPRVSDANTPHINALVHALTEQGRLSPRSIRNTRDCLRLLRNAAIEQGLLAPTRDKLRSVRVSQPVVEAWAGEQIERRLLPAVREFPGKCPDCGVAWSDWFTALILVGWETALRRGDLLGRWQCPSKPWHQEDALRWEHVQGDVIVKPINKTGRVAVKRIRRRTVRAVARLNRGQPLVFCFPKCSRTFHDMQRHLLASAGLSGSLLRYLRRSAATDVELAERGSAKVLLAHVTDGVAEKHYISSSLMRTREPLPRALKARRA